MSESIDILSVEDEPNTVRSGLNKNQLVPPVQLKIGRVRKRLARLSLTHLSIKQRLPLLIGVLLLGVIIASTWVSYRGVRDSALEAGRERLFHVAQQLAALFQQSSTNSSGRTLAAANDPAIRAYLRSPLPGQRAEVAAVLQQFLPPRDTHSSRIELWKADHSLVLALPEDSSPMPGDIETEFKQAASGPFFSSVGIIRVFKDTITYPIVAAVKDEAGQPIGYLVRWRQLGVSAEARKQFMTLIGARADLFVGNNQGDLWTDLENIVPKPPVEVRSTRDVVHYERKNGSPVTALARTINGTPWVILVEFSDQEILAQADRFLRRMTLMGLALFALGMACALILSRSITRPLRSLTEAASTISGGSYYSLAEVHTLDELGTLATTFNMMASRVRESQLDLEEKIWQRTAQLEAANRELESFSYSVSHDLRAPLRSIAGFSRILHEEYEPHLPAEAQQHLHRVQENAEQMGRLIDDLLGFSRLGRQALNKQVVAPAELAQTVMEDLHDEYEQRQVKVVIGDLPVCQADPALLKQVFVNLLANALKFTRQQAAALIEIGCRQEGDNIVYFVKDNGVGFDMQYAHKLFGVFQRLHRAEEYEGTGVGLATVQRIINRHGGRIWAEAEPGQGATFFFTLGGGSK